MDRARCVVTPTLPSTVHLYSAEEGCRPEARCLAARQPWLPACWRRYWQLRWISSPPGPVRALAERDNKFSGHGGPRQEATLRQVSSSRQPGKPPQLPTQPQTYRKAQETVCRVAPHLGASQPPGSPSLPSSLQAAVHVPPILRQRHQRLAEVALLTPARQQRTVHRVRIRPAPGSEPPAVTFLLQAAARRRHATRSGLAQWGQAGTDHKD